MQPEGSPKTGTAPCAELLEDLKHELLGALRKESQAGAFLLRQEFVRTAREAIGEAAAKVKAEVEAQTSTLRMCWEADLAQLRAELSRWKDNELRRSRHDHGPLGDIADELQEMRANAETNYSTILSEIRKVRGEMDFTAVIGAIKSTSTVHMAAVQAAITRNGAEADLSHLAEEVRKLRDEHLRKSHASSDLVSQVLEEVQKVKAEVSSSMVNASIQELKSHMNRGADESRHRADVDFVKAVASIRDDTAKVDFGVVLRGMCEMQSLVLLAIRASKGELSPRGANAEPWRLQSACEGILSSVSLDTAALLNF